MKLASTDLRSAQIKLQRKPRFSAVAMSLLILAGSVGSPAVVLAQSPSQESSQTSSPQAPSSQASPQQESPPQVSPAAAAQAPNNQPAVPVTEVVPATTAEADRVLPHDLTPIGMFMAADKVVKAVMIGLALASVLTWSVWLAKVIELFSARRNLLRDLHVVEQSPSLGASCEKLKAAKSDIALLARAAAGEIQRSRDAMNHDGVKERIASIFSRIEAAAARRMTRGTGILATIGSTGPFVGLFGTVWGIMNSFIGISKSQTTNLAVVAPGIAEALLATALGLVAAIPAVMIYNMFARSIMGYRGLLGDGSAELMRMVSRDLDRVEFLPNRRAAE